VLGLVVCRDGDIDVFQRRVRVAERNDGDVDVGSLSDSLVVYSGVGDDEQSWLFERSGDVIGE